MTPAFTITLIVAFLLAAVVVVPHPLTVSAFTPLVVPSASGTTGRPRGASSISPSTPAFSTVPSGFLGPRQMSSTTETMVGPEIEVVYQPTGDFLEKKGCLSWGTWGCGVSKFPWTYDSTESCYLLKGKVTVTPTDGRKAVTFGAGDFVTFPAGMSCTWDVTEAVQKHFMFY
jgi:uncharacterized cupin superfamily protein